MKAVLFAAVCALLLVACQKEITSGREPEPPAGAGASDSTLLRQFAIVRHGAPAGYGDGFDTALVERFAYDPLKRLVRSERYDSLAYTYPWVYDTYHYQGAQRQPYKITRIHRYISLHNALAYDTLFFGYDAAGRMIYDSTRTEADLSAGIPDPRTFVISISQSGNYLQLSGDLNEVYEYRAANGLPTYLRDTMSSHLTSTYEYDTHPNPLYRPELEWVPGLHGIDMAWLTGGAEVRYRRKNNLVRLTELRAYPPIPTEDVYTYTYRADGYPVSARLLSYGLSNSELQYSYYR